MLTKKQIEDWLLSMRISNYVINDDLSVDVNGDVYMSHTQLTKIPIRFGKVGGDFYCDNNKLTSLKNCPTSVGGDFYCFGNKLVSLEHCPTAVGGDFYCFGNKLTTLEHHPTSVRGLYAGDIKVKCSPDVSKWVITKQKDLFFNIDKPSPDMTTLYQMLWEF